MTEIGILSACFMLLKDFNFDEVDEVETISDEHTQFITNLFLLIEGLTTDNQKNKNYALLNAEDFMRFIHYDSSIQTLITIMDNFQIEMRTGESSPKSAGHYLEEYKKLIGCIVEELKVYYIYIFAYIYYIYYIYNYI